MRTTRTSLMALLVVLAFGLVACNGEPGPDPDDNGVDDNGEVETISVESPDTAPFEGLPDTLDAGTYEFELTNTDTMTHDLVIEGPDGQDVPGAATEVLGEGETGSFTVELEPGEYVVYCSVPGHREDGMENELTVE